MQYQENFKQMQEDGVATDEINEQMNAVPSSIKPYLNTDLNFDVFVNLLSDKVDLQRVSLSVKQIKNLEFSCDGYPKIIIEIFCFLTSLAQEQMLELKRQQLNINTEAVPQENPKIANLH